MEKEAINEGHYLELMDRLYVVGSTIDDFILRHPLTESDEEIRSKVDQALDLLMDVYQIVGKKSK